MALSIGELYVELTARGNLAETMRQSEQGARQLERTTENTRREVNRLGDDHSRTARDMRRDTKQNTREIGDMNRRVDDTRDGMRRVGTETRDTTRNVQRLGDQAKSTSNDVGRMGKEGREAGRDIERGMSGARQALGKVEDAAEKAGNGLSSLTEQLGSNAGGSTGGAFLASFSGKLGKLGGKGGPIAMALVGVAAVGVAAGAVLADAIGDGMQTLADRKMTQARLGVSDATMKEIGRAAGDAYAGAWGESVSANMETARHAMQAGIFDGDATAADMQPVIERLTMVSDMLEEDIPRVARSAGQIMKTGLASNAEEAMDIVVAGFQNGLNVSEDWLDTLDEYSVQFSKLGLEGPQAIGLMSQALEAGVRDTDKAADALKEFAIRAVDGSKSTAEGFNILKLNAADMAEQIAQGGDKAAAGLDTVLDALREIEDPLEREAAAVHLFGTQAEDMQKALFAMDLSTATDEINEVGGAAARAGDAIESTAQHQWQSAMNTIQQSIGQTKTAMAEGITPMVVDLANVIQEHKPEIIAFFTGASAAALDFLANFTEFAAGFVRLLGVVTRETGAFVDTLLTGLASAEESFANLLDNIPGMGGIAEWMREDARRARDLANGFENAGDRMVELADSMDNGARSMHDAADGMRETGEEAANAAELTRALGDDVEALPTGKEILIESLTDEATERLEALGLKVETLPDGTVRVTADTDEGQQIIDDFIRRNDGRVMTQQVRVNYWTDQGYSAADAPNVQGPVPIPGTYADGGTRLPGEATVQNPAPNLIQWAEPETGGEAFIPLSRQKRGRSMQVLSDVAQRFGQRVVPMAEGGIVEDMTGLVGEKFPALTMTSGYRNSNDHHGSGKAADFSNGQGNTDEQLALANYIADNYPDSMELIYSDPRFDRNIKNGQFVDRGFYGAQTMAGHQNHVHWAIGYAPSGKAQSQQALTEEQRNTDTFVKVAEERGMGRKAAEIAVAAGLVESNMKHLDHGDRDSVGVLQQRPSQGWGPAGETPEQDVNQFYDHLQGVDGWRDMDPGAAAQAVQRSAYPDRYGQRMDDAKKMVDESYARQNGGGGGDSLGATSSGEGMPVRVTNWPSNLGGGGGYSSSGSSSGGGGSGGGTSTAKSDIPSALSLSNGGDPGWVWYDGGKEKFDQMVNSIANPGGAGQLSDSAAADLAEELKKLRDRQKRVAPLNIEAFANGGFGGVTGASEHHLAQIANAGSMRVWAEPETGGEAYIPLGNKPGQRNRALQVWAETGYRLGVGSVGIAHMLGSMVGSDGSFDPRGFSTGSTRMPGVDQALGNAENAIKEIISQGAVFHGPVTINDPQQYVQHLLNDAIEQVTRQGFQRGGM